MTATLRCIEDLVTGPIPTFIGVGYNFGAASIAEDSITQQLRRSNWMVRFCAEISSSRALINQTHSIRG